MPIVLLILLFCSSLHAEEEYMYHTAPGGALSFIVNHDYYEIDLITEVEVGEDTMRASSTGFGNVSTAGLSYNHNSHYNEYLLSTEASILLPVGGNHFNSSDALVNGIRISNEYSYNYKIDIAYKIGLTLEHATLFFSVGLSFLSLDLDTRITQNRATRQFESRNLFRDILLGAGILATINESSWVTIESYLASYENVNLENNVSEQTSVDINHNIRAATLSVKFHFAL